MMMQIPKGTKYKITLDTGRIICLKEISFRDFRIASQSNTSEEGNLDGLGMLEELTKSSILALFRANGESVDITNREKLFDEILTLEESIQLTTHPENFGLVLKKKAPKLEVL